ncbi:hypothetical protein RN001_007389 [Aquatica leii]|uniref:Mff-like domain-containing protein n=1 Tax=Aquatica leii TaxID=1421715 RepID=A0AAN7QIA1_9COLE|nr:hypothetical protein RN001_007389 [Aquatica leii]
MSSSTLQFGEVEDSFISDTNFKVDIGQRMKVPSKISFNQDVSNGITPNWTGANETLNMHVPERILVIGQEQHIGTRAPPREIVYDNSILAKDPYPGDVRVATPPRTLTLDKYQFPGVNEHQNKKDEEPEVHTLVKSKTQVLCDLRKDNFNSHRESTPPLNITGDALSGSEEILHLRRQLAKLNRRVMALELENSNILQREKIFYGIGIAYFLLKTIVWLNRSY